MTDSESLAEAKSRKIGLILLGSVPLVFIAIVWIVLAFKPETNPAQGARIENVFVDLRAEEIGRTLE